MKKVFIFLLMIFFYVKVWSQAPTTKAWDHRYGGNLQDNPMTMLVTYDNGFLLGGYSGSPISFDKSQSPRGADDYWVVRTDSVGNILWERTYGGNSRDYMLDAIALPDSGFLLGGLSFSGISGEKSDSNRDATGLSDDYWVVRIDKNGNKIWDKTFGGDKPDHIKQMVRNADGTFILAGLTASDSINDMTHHNYGVYDYWIVKIDGNGNKLWDKNYGGSGADYIGGIAKTNDHGFIIGGYSSSPVGGCKSQPNINNSVDYWFLKIDSVGNELWDRTLGGDSSDQLYSINILPGDSILIGGVSWSQAGFDKSIDNHSGFHSDFWIIKTDNMGNKIWDKAYGGNDYEDELDNVTFINDGYLICGTSYSNTSGDKSEDNILAAEQPWVIATDLSGNRLWDKTLHEPTHVEYNSGFQTMDGCYAFLSYADIDGGDVSQVRASSRDYWLVKYCSGLAPLPHAAYTASETAICQNTCLTFINQSQHGSAYQWYFPGGSPASSTAGSPGAICYNNSGTYDVTLIATNASGSDTLTMTNYITIYPQVPFSPILQNGDTLFSVTGYTSYQWYDDTTLINGATNYFFIAPHNGDFSVLITDSNGCTALAKKLGVIASLNEIKNIENNVTAFYSQGILSVKINSSSMNSSEIELTDALGKILLKKKIILQKGENVFSIPAENISKGIYFINVNDLKDSRKVKIFIQ